MRDIILDGSDWNANDDVMMFFDAVGAPSWHGRNFDLIKDIAKRGYRVEIQIYPGVKP
jgi:hypothetical protein